LKTSEILVVGPHGDRLKVYEREYREPSPGTQIERKHVAYEMSTGERVQIIDRDTFKSARTGALFRRLES
jgi:hypothetical protein